MIGSKIIQLPSADSTNNYASQLIKKNEAMEGMVIITQNQTHGKGQAENSWESENGKNLTCSIILMPTFLAVDKQFLISKIASLAIAGFLKKLHYDHISIKWPNDIYIGHRKIAGVLIENSIKGQQYDTAIIGIGLNINQTSFSESIPNPVSLKLLSNKDFNLDECLNMVLLEIESWYHHLKSNNYSMIDHEYINLLYHYKRWASYLYNSQTIRAKITGVNKYGMLQLENEDQSTIECDLKEIKYII